MGDASSDPGSRPSEHQQGTQQGNVASSGQYQGGSTENVPFHSQYSTVTQPPRIDTSRMQPGMAPYGPSPGQAQAASTFNMGAMAGALPDYQSQAQAQRGSIGSGNTPNSAYRGQQMPQYATASPYGAPYGMAQFQGGMGHDESAQSPMGPQGQRTGAMPGMQQAQFSPYAQQMPQYYYPTSPFSPQAQQQFFPPGGQGMPIYADRRTSMGSLQSPQVGFMGGAMAPQGGRQAQAMPGYGDMYASGAVLSAGEGIQRPASGSSMGSIPRGPPRKPKQSGHALWVGNLPPGTTVLDLKDHFSRDATRDIESLFLISKSNCAFVNYRSEASCIAAMQRFHDSRFHGVRLVCRLRRSSTTPSGVPSGPSAMTGSAPPSAGPTPVAASTAPNPEPEPEEAGDAAEKEPDEPAAPTEKVPSKYFVVKSLTLQDLELSVRNGIWATQSHNEQSLNKAYESAENVYLVFSANKSGEYFGYARMASPITEDSTQVYAAIPRHEPTEAADAPKVIPTEATEFAPKGHIIDDSARGTIFWEADHSDQEEEDKEKEGKDDVVVAADGTASGDEQAGQQTWGKPFKVEWISTNRLPFYRTRGLRNPWNANREVKIARDGTELEPGVGSRLLQMFHRMGQPPPAGPPIAMPMMGAMGMPVPPQMRPY